MFNELKVLRSKLDRFYQYTDDHSFWKKQNILHHDYFKLSVKLNQLLRKARSDYYKVICS